MAMDLDELKQSWNSQRFNVPQIDPASIRRANAFNGQLAVRYRTCALLSLIAVGPLTFCARQLDFPLWMTIYLCAFMLAMSAITSFEWHLASRIDFGIMNLTDALRSVYRLRKQMNMRLLAGIAGGTPLIIAMLIHYFHRFGTELLVAGGAGAVAGAIIGVNHALTNRRILSKMQAELNDATSTDE